MNKHLVDRSTLDLAFRALDDAKCEIEAFEKHDEGYTASQKMMDRIERAMKELKDALK
jgi:hypothetical protein